MKTTIKTGILSFGVSGSVFHAPLLKYHPAFEFSAIVKIQKKGTFKVPKSEKL